jgi:type IV secretion system protein VirB8
MNKVDYFTKAESWAVNAQETTSRSRRTAWTVAGIAAGIAMLEAVALAMLMPLKTVQPITLLVDRQTGFVQAVDPVHPRTMAADEALTQSFLAQYVAAREGFDRATLSADYRKVALWSGGPARNAYLAEMPATNPASPLQRYPGGTVVSVRVKSVSKLSDGTALVRFDTLRQDRGGMTDMGQPWVAVIRYRYVNAPMQLEDRLINPLGFQVIDYRRDAEGLPPAPPTAAPAMTPEAASFSAPPPQPGPAYMQPTTARSRAVEQRAVPINQVPMGSPLAGGRGE